MVCVHCELRWGRLDSQFTVTTVPVFTGSHYSDQWSITACSKESLGDTIWRLNRSPKELLGFTGTTNCWTMQQLLVGMSMDTNDLGILKQLVVVAPPNTRPQVQRGVV